MYKKNKSLKSKCIKMIIAVIFLLSGIHTSFAEAEKEFKELTLVNVVTTWADENEITWERHASIKETDKYRLYEVAINENNVKLYKFDTNLDTYYLTAKKREQYLVKSYTLPNKRGSEGASKYIADAFKDIFEIVVKDSPSTSYGLKYTGHGSWDGYLFGNNINASDAQEVLKQFTKALGRKVDFFDMSTNCNQATAGMLNAFYPYFDYILASELAVGGFGIDEKYAKKFMDVFDFTQYPVIFSDSTNLESRLKKLAGLSRTRWLYSQDVMTKKHKKQSVSIFKMSEYTDVINEYGVILEQRKIKDLNKLIKYGTTQKLKELYDKLVIYKATNEDFFKWDEPYKPFAIYQLSNITEFKPNIEAEQKAKEDAAREAEQKAKENAAREAEQRAKEEAAKEAEQKAKEDVAREAEQKAKEKANSSKSYWTVEDYSLESRHLYDNNIYTIDIVEKREAENIAIFFSKIVTEENVDYVYVLDENKKMVEKITGIAENKWVTVRGNVAYICLVTDNQNVEYGFKIDKIAHH